MNVFKPKKKKKKTLYKQAEDQTQANIFLVQ